MSRIDHKGYRGARSQKSLCDGDEREAMTVAQLKKMSDDELVEQANECFSKCASAGGLDKPNFLLEAQFYLSELSRRRQDKQTHQMLLMTGVILFLSVVMTFATVVNVWMR